MAREKFPGSPANLDALCRRFGIDNSSRTYHGALLDSQLLAEVYLELLGGRQRGLEITAATTKSSQTQTNGTAREYREPRQFSINEEERAAHDNMTTGLKDPLWKK